MAFFFLCIVRRELALALRRRSEALLPLAFFVVAATALPLSLGPQPRAPHEAWPAIAWVCALLASWMSARQLYGGDFADGSLEQLMLVGEPAWLLAAAKATAHWLVNGFPLVLAAPASALLLGLQAQAAAMLFAALLLGTPVLSLLGGLGAALSLGVRGGGMLAGLPVLLLSVPVLMLGSGASIAAAAGLPAGEHCMLLAALLLLGVALLPMATAAALRAALR